MDCYLKSTDYDIWYIIMHGDMIPIKNIDDRFVEEKLMRILMREIQA